MWRPWSKALERIGRIRTGGTGGLRSAKVAIGHPGSHDARGGWGWRQYRTGEALFEVWGPPAGSPWAPFHCVPLFAALDRVPASTVGPTPQPMRRPEENPPDISILPEHARPGAPAPPWLAADCWTILDLPGVASVKAAVWLMASARCQPVCTFENWPHPKGILQPEWVLAELLRWASTVADFRPGITTTSPPLWICDGERLGRRAGVPGEFDNRYFLDDSVVPTAGMLRQAGIRSVVYLTLGDQDSPLVDLEGPFADYLSASIPVLHARISDPALEPRPFATPPGPRRVPSAGYRRSAAGGFGTLVPEPSSGGGG
jgi:hypothetical protein